MCFHALHLTYIRQIQPKSRGTTPSSSTDTAEREHFPLHVQWQHACPAVHMHTPPLNTAPMNSDTRVRCECLVSSRRQQMTPETSKLATRHAVIHEQTRASHDRLRLVFKRLLPLKQQKHELTPSHGVRMSTAQRARSAAALRPDDCRSSSQASRGLSSCEFGFYWCVCVDCVASGRLTRASRKKENIACFFSCLN